MIIVEKILTQLVMPVGLVWLGLMCITILAWRRHQKAIAACLLALLVLFTAAGSAPLGTAMLGWLERDVKPINPLKAGPFDVVIVLGGGTNTNAYGQPQFDHAGDRVALGAQLYHAGRTRQIAVTGKRVTSSTRHPADEAAELLQRLGVPEQCILRLPGRNTSEEMATLSHWTAEHPDWKRLGLITSAWHIPRALRLARRGNLQLEPVPADFRGTPRPWTLWSIIPSAEGIGRTQIAAKEMLASLVGR